MESTLAEELPALYRAILDAVARLDANGERQRGARVRRDATAAYSRAWDERARRRLTALLRDASRPVVADKRRHALDRRTSSRPLATAVPPIARQDG
jgi:hypothetical protein